MRKAKLYGKIGKLILQEVKAGGPDAVANTRLKEILKQAQQAAIPKDIIDRNIKKGSDKSQADFQEVCITPQCFSTATAKLTATSTAEHARQCNKTSNRK